MVRRAAGAQARPPARRCRDDVTTSSAVCESTRGGPSETAPGEIDGPYSYVALGDSISIDEYAGVWVPETAHTRADLVLHR